MNLTVAVGDCAAFPADAGGSSITPGIPRTIRVSTVVVISQTYEQ